jgi:ABC-type transport system substrate-binding protein
MVEVTGPGISRRDLFRYAGLAGLAVGSGGLLAACDASPSGKSQSGNGTSNAGPAVLNLAFNRDLVTIDNKTNQFDALVTVQQAVREGLVGLDAQLELQNVLAESFEQTGPREWTVRLLGGLKYSDGSPVQVNDVATAIAAYKDTPNGYIATQFPEWPAAEPVDDRTFKLVTKDPNYALDRLMANILLLPTSVNGPKDVDVAPGTGPFVVKSANSGAGTYQLTRNPEYRGTAAGINTVNIRYIAENSVRVAALQRGEVHIIDSLPPDVAQQVESGDVSDISLIRSEGVRLGHLFYNFRKPSDHPLANPKVREALSYAIDGTSIVKNILLGSVTPLEGLVPSTLVDAAKVGQYTFDPNRAKQMLDSEGVTGLKLRMIWESGEFFSDAQVMETIAGMLRDVGVTTELKQFAPGGDLGAWRRGETGDWDVLGNGYPNLTGLALDTLRGIYGGTPEKEKTRDSYHGYVFPDIAAQINSASQTDDAAERSAILKKAQEEVWATWPAMWAFAQNNALAHRSSVQGIKLRPNNSYDLGAVRLA